MATKQGTTITGESAGGLGKRNTANIKAAYPSSPLYSGGSTNNDALTDDGTLGADCAMRVWYQTYVLDGNTNNKTPDGETRANDAFPGVSMDFDDNGAPTLISTQEVPGLAGGSEYIPNLASPGEGNGLDASAKPANLAAAQPQGHMGENGTVQTPSASSATQSTFSLTNMPNPGNGPA